jgi:hypothetical protein
MRFVARGFAAMRPRIQPNYEPEGSTLQLAKERLPLYKRESG